MGAINFKALRLREGMTQKEFADLLGVSESTVAAIENERRSISSRVRVKMAERLESGEEFLSFFERLTEIERILST